MIVRVMIVRAMIAAVAVACSLLPHCPARAQQPPEIRPGDTIIWEIGQGFHGVLFKTFGENGQYNFNDIKNVFDMNLDQFVSSDDPSRVYTDTKGKPGDVVLTAKVKSDAMKRGIQEIPFWSVEHELSNMNGVLRLASATADNPNPRQFHIKALRVLTWVLNDGQRDYVLPKVQGLAEAEPAMTSECPCMRMMGGEMGGMMGQSRMMQPRGQVGMNMPGVEDMLRTMQGMTTPRSMGGGMGGMCGGMGGMCGGGPNASAAGGSASGFRPLSKQRAAAGAPLSDEALADVEEYFQKSPLLRPAQKPRGNVSLTATGTIMSVDSRTRSINLRHAPIPAINWPAMTMDFAVGPEVDLSSLKSGQDVEFTMERQPSGGEAYTITSVKTKG